MKFIFGIFFVVLVALATAEEVTEKPVPVNIPELNVAESKETNVRNKRGFVLSTYAAPVPSIPIAAPEIIAPYPYTYRTYIPSFSYPTFYY